MSEHYRRFRTTIYLYSTKWSYQFSNSQLWNCILLSPVKHSTPQMSVHHIQCEGYITIRDILNHFLKLQFKYSIKDTKYNIFLKAGCNQVTYGIKSMQYNK